MSVAPINPAPLDFDIYKILGSKITRSSELVIIFFEHCNLKCVFCPQDHNSMVGATREEILAKSDTVAKFINNSPRSKDYKLHLLGGELFEDLWIEKGFLDVYEEFMDLVRSKINIGNKRIYFNYLTNFMFDKKNSDKVMDFCNKHDVKLSTSYDPRGRFNKGQLEIFLENVETFKDYIRNVSIVTTSQNVQTIIKSNDKSTFDYLYKNFPIDFDAYMPSPLIKADAKLIPKDSELLAFNKYLVDNYPECENMDAFHDPLNQTGAMMCTRGNSITIQPDGSSPGGCCGVAYQRDKKTGETLFETGEMVEKFLKKYNCFECEYYENCPFTCFVKADMPGDHNDMEECVFKETFNYVKKTKGFKPLRVGEDDLTYGFRQKVKML